MSDSISRWIDLRSDTVTQPCAAMRAAMADAPVGDDVYGDDPTVNRLQQVAAGMFGFEAGMFLPSGTQSNLVALMTHCARGDEYLVGQEAHTYKFEGGGAAVLGSIQPQPIQHQPDGSFLLTDIAAAVKPVDIHFAQTRLLSLENTIGGKVLPQQFVQAATRLAHDKGLATHLDGARICNAAVKEGMPLPAAVAGFDTVSVCLSKGLGAPVGSVLLGPKDFITAAKRWRKMLGGGLRQAGVLAAAGLYALEHNIARLKDDHENAARLAAGLARIDALDVEAPQTNILWLSMPPAACAGLAGALKEAGIRASVSPRMRLVTHLDVRAEDIGTTLAVFERFFEKWHA